MPLELHAMSSSELLKHQCHHMELMQGVCRLVHIAHKVSTVPILIPHIEPV
jgi:hypothetical protein